MGNLKFAWTYAVKRRGLIAATTLFMIIESLAATASIAFQQRIIDNVILNRQFHLLFWFMMLIAAAYLIHCLFMTLAPQWMYKIVTRVRRDLSVDFMKSMYRIPIRKLQQERTSNYLYQFATDVGDIGHVTNFLAGDITRGIRHVVSLAVLIVLFALTAPVLLPVLLALSVLYVVVGRYFAPQLKQAAAEVNRTRSDMLVHLEEGVSATREVVAFHRQKWELGYYNQRFSDYFAKLMSECKVVNKVQFLGLMLRWSVSLSILIYGGVLVLDEKLTIGLFIVLYQLSLRMMDDIDLLYDYMMRFPGRMASVERLRAVMEGPQIEEGGQALTEPVHSLGLNGVTFRYDDAQQPILRNVTVNLPIGRKLAVIGTSGGGKSTLSTLLVRFYEPEQGAIVVNGKPLSAWKREDWLHKVALVSQEPYFFPDTIRMNLRMGNEDISEEEMIAYCQKMLIHDTVAALPNGYDTVLGERGVTLSGGQRQRLAIVRALLREPEILLLDEATSALDLETERVIQRNLDELRAGKTTIIIAHRLSTIRNADHIYEVQEGHMTEKVVVA